MFVVKKQMAVKEEKGHALCENSTYFGTWSDVGTLNAIITYS
jgi:hypothetical protein